MDEKHFFSNVYYASYLGGSILKKAGEYEERWQSINPESNANARTSAFSPEDLLTNRLGQMYAGHLPSGETNISATLAGFLAEVSELFQTNTVANGKYLGATQIADLREIAGLYGTSDFRDFQRYGESGAAWQPSRRDNLVTGTQAEAATSVVFRAKVWTYGFLTDILPGLFSSKEKNKPAPTEGKK